MKRILFILSVMAVVLASCDRVYINGDLDGMWQLQKVELPDSDVYPQNIYYSYQRHMAQVSENYEEGLPLRYLGILEYSGDSLKMSSFRKFLEEDIVATEKELARFFLYDTATTFKIEKLDNSQLILISKRGRYSLKKW